MVGRTADFVGQALPHSAYTQVRQGVTLGYLMMSFQQIVFWFSGLNCRKFHRPFASSSPLPPKLKHKQIYGTVNSHNNYSI